MFFMTAAVICMCTCGRSRSGAAVGVSVAEDRLTLLCSLCGGWVASARLVGWRFPHWDSTGGLELSHLPTPVGGAPKSPEIIATALIKVDIDVKINHKSRLEFKSQEVILTLVLVSLTSTQSDFAFLFCWKRQLSVLLLFFFLLLWLITFIFHCENVLFPSHFFCTCIDLCVCGGGGQ